MSWKASREGVTLGLSDAARLQAHLPIRLGGFGLLSCAALQDAAFVGSLNASRALRAQLVPPHWAVPGALAAVARVAPLFSDSSDVSSARQRDIASLVHAGRLQSFRALLTSDRDRARYAALCGRHCNGWLTAIPSVFQRQRMYSRSFRASCRYRAGLPMYDVPDTTLARCSGCGVRRLDKWGDHALSCSGTGDRTTRHNLVCDAGFKFCRAAGLSPVRELPDLLPGNISRPADIYVERWCPSTGSALALDVTVVSPLAPSMRRRVAAADTSAYAASVAEDAKRSKHLQACRQRGVTFIPLAFETLGAFGPASTPPLQRIAALCAKAVDRPVGTLLSALRRRISIAIQRGNGAMLVRRAPNVNLFLTL